MANTKEQLSAFGAKAQKVAGKVGNVDTAKAKERMFRDVWATQGEEARALAKAHGGGSARGLAIELEAGAMVAASKGLVKLAASGELPKLEALVDALNSADKRYDGGLAWVISGANFLALPWPLRSAAKAQQLFRLALKADGESLRNLYYCGLAALDLGDKAKAVKFFRKALSVPALRVSDRDIEPVIREQARAGIERCT